MTALSAQASIFKFEHNDTISAVASGTAGLAAGQSAKITIALDNGGTSLNSQTWITATDLKWVSFDFNNGAVLTTFTAPFNGGLSLSNGNFTTDASGVLLSVMSAWNDTSVGTDYSSNIDTANIWRLNGVSTVTYQGNPSGQVSLTNKASIPTVGGWQVVADAPVPEPSSLALLAMGAAFGVGRLRKR